MKIKYQSEGFRKGHTEQEMRVAQAVAYWTIPALNKVICFDCGQQYQMPDPTSFPQSCSMCDVVYESVGQYCLPDVIIEKEDKKSVIFVNGLIHERNKNKARDKYQIMRLKQLGYTIFVIANEEIDYLKNANLLAIMYTYIEATTNSELYYDLMKNEKEITGLHVGI